VSFVRRVIAGLVVSAMVAACGGGTGASPGCGGAGPASAACSIVPAASPSSGRTALKVGLGYYPSVQFAQFYYAYRQGYYRDAGLDVTFQNGRDDELTTLIGQGAVDIGISDGTSVIPAASQGIPIKYAATIYGQFPSVVVTKTTSGISKAADLKGHKFGIPGKYGSSWVMLQALLSSAGLTPDDLIITLYPDYGQAVALSQGQVDAATGFANNEPVQLKLQGIDTTVLHVDQIVPLPGPGLVVGTATLAAKHDALKAFVAATLRAMTEIKADPQKGVDASIAAVQDLGTNPTLQRAILDATIAIWSSPYTDAHGLGAIDTAAWAKSVAFMDSMPDGAVPSPLPAEQLVTTELLP
jgi:NitT/TauT family transport system substrate-binding protein